MLDSSAVLIAGLTAQGVTDLASLLDSDNAAAVVVSRFARQYQERFGELPSDTARSRDTA